MTTLDVQRRIETLGPWFHNLHLPDGTQTCPGHRLGDFPTVKWNSFKHLLPERLDDWSVLDVGCNAGFYSFEVARRGARVTAIDVEDHYLDQARWAASCYGLADRVQFRRAHVYELARTTRRWDLVLFLGVMYHLRYPLLGLDVVARRTRQLMVFQCLSMLGSEVEPEVRDMELDDRDRFSRPGWPKLAFIEHRLADDPTNWWAPNRACIEAMMRSTGMRVRERPVPEIFLCEPDPESRSNVWRTGNPDYEALFGPAEEVDEP